MSVTIGLAEAKARLSEFIDRVEAGETITISRNGNLVAELRPVKRKSAAEVVAAIKAIQGRVRRRNEGKKPWPPPGKRLREIAHEGHRR